MNPFHNLKYILLGLMVMGCDLVSKEAASYPFDVKIDVKDGLISGSGMLLQRPEMSFRITSEDPGAVYTLIYSIDGGDSEIRGGLVGSDVFLNLGSEFSSMTKYGSHTIKGKVSLDKDKNRVKAFTATIWVKYAPVTVSDMYFSSYSGRKAFREKCVLDLDSSGDFVIVYSPTDSYTNVDIKCEPVGILEFELDKLAHEEGLISIPYSVKAIGEPRMTVSFTNGPDEQSFSYEVDCRDNGNTDYFVPFCDVPEAVMSGASFSVSVGLTSGNIEMPYRLCFKLDGEEIGLYEGVVFSPVVTYSFGSEGLAVGSHEFSCEVVAGEDRSELLSSAFYIVPSSLFMADSQGNVISVMPDVPVVLQVGRSYSLSFDGVPEEIMSFLTFVAGELGSFDGAEYLASGRGQTGLTVEACEGRGGSIRYSFSQIDKVCVNASIDDFSLVQEGVWTLLSLEDGDSSLSYTIDYYIDGQLFRRSETVLMNEPVECVLSDVPVGEHQLTVRVASYDGQSSVWEKTVDVYVSCPELQVRGTGDVIYDLPYYDCEYGMDFDYKKHVTLSLTGVPVRYLDRFDIVQGKGSYVLEKSSAGDGNVSWDIDPNTLGEQSFVLVYRGRNELNFEFPFDCYESINISLRLSGTDEDKTIVGEVSKFSSFTNLTVDTSFSAFGIVWVQFQEGDYLEPSGEQTWHRSKSFRSGTGTRTLSDISVPNSAFGNGYSIEYLVFTYLCVEFKRDGLPFTPFHKVTVSGKDNIILNAVDNASASTKYGIQVDCTTEPVKVFRVVR